MLRKCVYSEFAEEAGRERERERGRETLSNEAQGARTLTRADSKRNCEEEADCQLPSPLWHANKSDLHKASNVRQSRELPRVGVATWSARHRHTRHCPNGAISREPWAVSRKPWAVNLSPWVEYLERRHYSGQIQFEPTQIEPKVICKSSQVFVRGLGLIEMDAQIVWNNIYQLGRHDTKNV